MSGAAIEILYEEGPCLVVNKPSGLLTQSPPGIDSLEWRIKAFLQERDARPGRIYLGVPHRLDRPASGAMVFGIHSRAAHRLSKQFERREVEKTYWACVAGAVEPAEGTWINYTRKIPDEAQAEIVGPEHPEGREAILRYRTLGVYAWGTWLEVALETGRMHQIRIQAAFRGHPVLGDVQYGSTVPFGPQHEDPRLRAIALHARTLSFQHPMTRTPVAITAPLPLAWGELTG
jgi:23S rRNA pseudouridine1911/1915/1917 synthase